MNLHSQIVRAGGCCYAANRLGIIQHKIPKPVRNGQYVGLRINYVFTAYAISE